MTDQTVSPATLWGWERTVNDLIAGSDVAYQLDYDEFYAELVIAVHLDTHTVYLDPKVQNDWRADIYWAADANRIAGAVA